MFLAPENKKAKQVLKFSSEKNINENNHKKKFSTSKFFFVLQHTGLSCCINSTLCSVQDHKVVHWKISGPIGRESIAVRTEGDKHLFLLSFIVHLFYCAMQPKLPCVICISQEFNKVFPLFLSRNVHFDISLCTSEVLRELIPHIHDLTMGQVTSPRFPSQHKCVWDSLICCLWRFKIVVTGGGEAIARLYEVFPLRPHTALVLCRPLRHREFPHILSVTQLSCTRCTWGRTCPATTRSWSAPGCSWSPSSSPPSPPSPGSLTIVTTRLTFLLEPS